MKVPDYPPYRSCITKIWMQIRFGRPWPRYEWTHDEQWIKPSNPWYIDVDESQNAILFLENIGVHQFEPEAELIDPEKIGDAITDEKGKQELKIQEAIRFAQFAENIQ